MSTAIPRDAEGTVTGNTYDKYGSTNPVNVTRATLEGLRSLHSAAELSARRGVPVRLHIPGQPAAMEAADGR